MQNSIQNKSSFDILIFGLRHIDDITLTEPKRWVDPPESVHYKAMLEKELDGLCGIKK